MLKAWVWMLNCAIKVSAMAVPSVEVIKAENKFWVVDATAKEEVQYRPFEQVKAV